ncbi:hypothetical protein HPB50_005256 [Hyalomma asiaticum]|uniref:Uncharacterized protein n=1 Tax=Hyalomma asiaticum TaxID=266040 RepID=A0ACB7SZT1_HYAAI|nr:hypothetical protein HPB50_005256 [Hyalomma asiaticum]
MASTIRRACWRSDAAIADRSHHSWTARPPTTPAYPWVTAGTAMLKRLSVRITDSIIEATVKVLAYEYKPVRKDDLFVPKRSSGAAHGDAMCPLHGGPTRRTV